jgi:hypothetical protein
MLDAGGEDADEVKPDQHKHQIGREPMGLFDPFYAPIGIGGHKKTRGAGGDQRGKQGNHHGAPGWVVADIAPGPKTDHVDQIAKHRPWPIDEVAEAGVGCADETP